MGKGYKYTAEQWKEITNADCVEVARALGYEFDEKRSDKNSLHIKDHSGLFVWRNGKGWYQHSTGAQGYATDLVMFAKGCNYKQAMEYIFSNVLGRSDYEVNKQYHSSVHTTAQKEKPEFKLPERAANHKRVFAYLTQTRCISKKIVASALEERTLYQDNKYGNCCFVGFDKDGNPRYCNKRSTNSDIQFRGEAAGSDKAFGWKIQGSLETGAKLYIFEAPIDAMSHATLNEITGRDWKKDTRLAMGGCSMLPIEQHLKDYPDKYSEIVICTDNDERGNEMAGIIKEKLIGRYKVTRRSSFAKDWNEDLTNITGIAGRENIPLKSAVGEYYHGETADSEINRRVVVEETGQDAGEEMVV